MSENVRTPIQELRNKEWKIRQEAVRQLEVTGDKSAVDDLLKALDREDSMYVRMAIVRALGKIGDAKAIPALLGIMNDGTGIIRQSALWALSEIGFEAKSAVAEIEKFADSEQVFDQGDLTIGKLAQTAVAVINTAEDPALAPPPAEAEAAVGEGAGAGAGAEDDEEARKKAERLAKREAALARKRAEKEAKGE